jgi:hypothetical protein
VSTDFQIRNSVMEGAPVASNTYQLAQEIYCGQCHLATASWRNRCIHCFKPLQRGPLRTEA